MQAIREYMEEKRLVSRWLVLVIGLTGAFAGAVLMLMMALLGIASF